MQRDRQSLAGLLLNYSDAFAGDVLSRHAMDVAAALAGIEHQGKCEPLPCPYRPKRLKATDFFFAPRANFLCLGPLDPERRIVVVPSYFERVAN